MADINLDSGKINFWSGADFQKIYMLGDQDVTVTSPAFRQSLIINHDLGYYPLVRVWQANDLGDISECIGGGMATFEPWWDGAVYYFVTTTQLIIYVEAWASPPLTRHVWWRIYLDAA